MVVYDLICDKSHRFEGWFPSFESFREQAAQGRIACPTCGTTGVEKLPHACAVHVKKDTPKARPAAEKRPSQPVSETDIKEFLLRVHHYVRENFEDVGPRFADEARKIIRGEVEKRSIHGTSTSEEQSELDDEGIPYFILPKPELDS